MLVGLRHRIQHVTRKQQKRAYLQHAFSRNDLKRDILNILNLEDTPSAFAIERSRGVTFASAAFLYTIPFWSIKLPGWRQVLYPKGALTLGRERIILISGVHYVSSEWRQVEIQPGTQAEDRSAEA
jgi:hypothetical protein